MKHDTEADDRGVARNLLRRDKPGVWGRKTPERSRGRIWKP